MVVYSFLFHCITQAAYNKASHRILSVLITSTVIKYVGSLQKFMKFTACLDEYIMKFVHIIPTLSSVRFCCITKYNFVSAKPPPAVGLMQLKRKTCAEVEPESDTDDEWFPHLCQPKKVKTAAISGASTSNFFSMFLFTVQC